MNCICVACENEFKISLKPSNAHKKFNDDMIKYCLCVPCLVTVQANQAFNCNHCKNKYNVVGLHNDRHKREFNLIDECILCHTETCCICNECLLKYQNNNWIKVSYETFHEIIIICISYVINVLSYLIVIFI